MTLQMPPPDPSVDEIRAALARATDGAGLRSSPQLAAFLRFIVEARLRGQADSIRAATIGTGALGRAADFNPQNDPIVRVEANRLRRALAAYYDGAGADDPIIIDIPSGRYVPQFRRRFAAREDGAVPAPVPASARGRRRWLMPATAVLVLIGVVVAGAVWLTASPAPPGSSAGAFSAPPIVLVEAIEAEPSSASTLASALGRELVATLTHIQAITVASDATAVSGEGLRNAGGMWAHAFRLTGLVDMEAAASAHVTLRLVADGAIVWTRDWHINAEDAAEVAAVSRDTALDIGRLSGVMHARLRAQSDYLSSGYRCILAAADSLRKFDLTHNGRVRECLERSTAEDPNFSLAFAILSFIYEREYFHDLPARAGEPPAIELSLGAAKRALALAPNSVLGHLAMMENLYIRGDLAAAFAAGERAVSLNPLDPAVSGLFGLRLLLGGETERGGVLLTQGAARFGANPSYHEFGLFCLAYLKGDMVTASQHADLDVTSTYPYGLLARALVTAASGDRSRARQTLHRLRALYPGWSDPKAMMERFIRSPAIVERFMRDIDAINAP